MPPRKGARTPSRHAVRDGGEIFEALDQDAGDDRAAPGQTPVGTAVISHFTSILIALVTVAGACAPAGPPAPPFVAIETADATRFVRVEIAETETIRERGLMGRTTLDEDAGMLFIWPEDTSSGFWMKDTRLRLSIAFISADGKILRTFDMEPCTGDPCPVYEPRTSYRMALEVRQGALDRLGVRVGDRVRLVR